jgi:hypothetical protein
MVDNIGTVCLIKVVKIALDVVEANLIETIIKRNIFAAWENRQR